MWDIAICDKDAEAARALCEKLEELPLPCPHRIHLYNSGQALIDEISERRMEPSIAILDIHIGEESGIALAAHIQQLRRSCQIIFTSESGIYPEGIYDVSHIYFLVKPVSREALGKAAALGISRLETMKKECMYVRNKSGDFVIPFDDICSLEKEKRKILVRTVNGEACSFYGKFEDIEDQLKQTFVRCHHSFIVNLYRVKNMGKDYFILWDDRKIPISRTYIKQVRQQFAAYAGEEYECGRMGQPLDETE